MMLPCRNIRELKFYLLFINIDTKFTHFLQNYKFCINFNDRKYHMGYSVIGPFTQDTFIGTPVSLIYLFITEKFFLRQCFLGLTEIHIISNLNLVMCRSCVESLQEYPD